MDFGTSYTGWHIEGDLPNQVAVSTASTVCANAGDITHEFRDVPPRKEQLPTLDPSPVYIMPLT